MPWLYDDDGKDEASKVRAKMVKATLRLMPYLFAQVGFTRREDEGISSLTLTPLRLLGHQIARDWCPDDAIDGD